MCRELSVWPETGSRSMPRLFRSLWEGSNPLQGAVPGLVLEVQVGFTVSVRAQIMENGSKWVENRRIGQTQRPNASYGLSGPIWSTPEAKDGKHNVLLKENGPRRPRRTSAASLLLSAQAMRPRHQEMLEETKCSDSLEPPPLTWPMNHCLRNSRLTG